jgi:hypothetical protein
MGGSLFYKQVVRYLGGNMTAKEQILQELDRVML